MLLRFKDTDILTNSVGNIYKEIKKVKRNETLLAFKKVTTRIGKNGVHNVRIDGKVYQVHRLVAECWVKNPNKLFSIRHINGDKSDNRAENLEWCNRSDNHKISAINQLTVDKTIIRTFASIRDAARWLVEQKEANKVSSTYVNVNKCVNGHIPSAYGYKWERSSQEGASDV